VKHSSGDSSADKKVSMPSREELIHSHIQLMTAIQDESRQFQEFYLWLEKYMPPSFFEEFSQEHIMLIAHSLMGFHLQQFVSHIHLKNAVIALSLESSDADVKTLKRYSMYGIKNYRAFISSDPFPAERASTALRVAVIHFTGSDDSEEKIPFSQKYEKDFHYLLKKHDVSVNEKAFKVFLSGMNSRFLRSLPAERLSLALDLFFRAQGRDKCQYEVRYNEDWENDDTPSMHIVFAWKNIPKKDFLYRIAKVVYRHDLTMKKVNAAYIDPYSRHSTLIMSLGLHGNDGRAVWDVADIQDFLQELVSIKYFIEGDRIENSLVTPGFIRGNLGNLLRAMMNFIHQSLVNVNVDLYTLENVEEALCRHPELTLQICEAFEYKFHPKHQDLSKYRTTRDEFNNLVERLDTGREVNDTRRRNVLKQGMNFIEHTLKTNFYLKNKTAFSFRLSPEYLEEIPFDRKKKFPDLPYAIFFIKGLHFFGFHIRFKDLSRGGLRTIFPEKMEHVAVERNNIFTECYSLAYTQHKKNKDIPEGGSKGTIFVKPYLKLQSEAEILKHELKSQNVDSEEIANKVQLFLDEQKTEYIYQIQRSFVDSLLDIVNCDESGKLRRPNIIDYWHTPEYIYIGPDENMHNSTIEWIATRSEQCGYEPGVAFISSKPRIGINHKEWGVTSLGVNVYMHEILKHIGIDPDKDTFTVKISGGPDGDVAGNQIKNLYRFYRKTAKLLALTDVSGTIYDPNGLDLDEMMVLYGKEQPIKYYPPEKLSEGGFLLDRTKKRDESEYVQTTLCWRKKDDELVEDWLSGSEMNQLFRCNVHKVTADVFIPAGGRPRTLNENNYKGFLDKEGNPTAKAIVEGANLYLTPEARSILEEKGVLIIKDSSANKGGVIASSFEVLCGLILSDEEMEKRKETLVREILDILQKCASDEAKLMLDTHKETGEPLTVISDKVSEKINKYKYQLLDYLEDKDLSKDSKDPFIRSFIQYSPPTLRHNYSDRLIKNVPDIHKKAIIACNLAAKVVYKHGIKWSPTIIDILPLIWEDKDFL
jgi:glutamate dehydrogenase